MMVVRQTTIRLLDEGCLDRLTDQDWTDCASAWEQPIRRSGSLTGMMPSQLKHDHGSPEHWRAPHDHALPSIAASRHCSSSLGWSMAGLVAPILA